MFSLQDTVRNLLADGRTTTEQAARFCSAMERAFPEAVVEPPAGLAEQLGCDPGDRHVLAAAIAAKAEVIVTLNQRHFPQTALLPLGIEAVTPAPHDGSAATESSSHSCCPAPGLESTGPRLREPLHEVPG